MSSEKQDTAKRVALITGANKGIGFEVARQLGHAGCTVLLGARGTGLGEKAASTLRDEGLDATFLALDLDRPETIQQAAAHIRDTFGHLDILINNAGINDPKDGPPETADLTAVERVMKINFHAALAVTQAMLPLVQASRSGRIVNVSSGLGSLTQHSDPDWQYGFVRAIGYCASKSALNMLTVQLGKLLRGTNIKVNSADPGYTATDLNNHSGPQTIQEGAAETVRLALLPDDGPNGLYFDTAGPVPW